MKRLFAVMCILSLSLSCVSPAWAGTVDISDDLIAFAKDKPISGWTYNTEYGFSEVACEPSVFKKQAEKAMKNEDAQKRASELQAVFSSYGFKGNAPFDMDAGVYSYAVLHGYGNVPAPWGDARVTLVMLSGGGVYSFFVFIKKASGWHLTDCIFMDYWDVNSEHPFPDFMRHELNKPGAWLVTRAIGHGTGVYIDAYQWYNVFTRQFDFAYTLEGFDSTMESDGWYYAGWKTELGFAPEQVGDTLRFITYEGMIKDPFDTKGSMGEEVVSAMVVHEYRYDAKTASYTNTREERLPVMSPGSVHASGFLRGQD